MNNIPFEPANESMCIERMEHYADRMFRAVENSSEFDFAWQQYDYWEWELTKHNVKRLIDEINVKHGQQHGIITV